MAEAVYLAMPRDAADPDARPIDAMVKIFFLLRCPFQERVCRTYVLTVTRRPDRFSEKEQNSSVRRQPLARTGGRCLETMAGIITEYIDNNFLLNTILSGENEYSSMFTTTSC